MSKSCFEGNLCQKQRASLRVKRYLAKFRLKMHPCCQGFPFILYGVYSQSVNFPHGVKMDHNDKSPCGDDNCQVSLGSL